MKAVPNRSGDIPGSLQVSVILCLVHTQYVLVWTLSVQSMSSSVAASNLVPPTQQHDCLFLRMSQKVQRWSLH